MLVFRDGVAERYIRGRNRLASPYRYELEIDPEVWFLEDEGYELAVFHSHPETEPRPSRTDRELSGLWAGKPFLIYGLKLEELRAWRITPDDVEELPLEESGGGAADERGRADDLLGLPVAVDPADSRSAASLGHLVERLADGRSVGRVCEAIGASSKPDDRDVVGHARPASRRARSAPTAIRSEAANTASISGGARAAGSSPVAALLEEVALGDEVFGRKPRAARARRDSRRAVDARAHVRRPRDGRDRAAPEPEQMLDALAGPAPVVGVHVRERRAADRPPDEDGRDAGPL